LDWRIEPSEQFQTVLDSSIVHSGKRSVKIHFTGHENVEYANLSQIAYVVPGRYFLSAWVRTERITTDEGVRLEVRDAEIPARLELKTDSIAGSADWHLVGQAVLVGPLTNLIAIRAVRNPSHKFDNKISGTVWLDDVALTRFE
jgi:hypothetical protein